MHDLRKMLLEIRILGEYSVLIDHERVPISGKPRFQSLLAYFILHHDRRLSRAKIAFDMWPDASERQAQTNLRNLLFRFQKFMPLMKQCLEIDRSHIRWRPQVETRIDAFEFLDLVTVADQELDVEAQIQAFTSAVRLYRGDLLPTLYDDWIFAEQERFRDLYADVLQRLVALHESRHEYDLALDYARRLVNHDPLSERAHYRLIRLYMTVRDRAAALHAFHDCQAVFQRELGIAPAEEILALHNRILGADASLLPPPDAPATALDEPPSVPAAGIEPFSIPLVGRQAEWAQLMTIYRQLSAKRPYLALLSGVAGIGKTRLAEELVHWADLQGVTTAVAHCYAAQRQTAYTPLIAWLRSDAINKHLSALPPIWLKEIARLLPELLERDPELPGAGPMHDSWQRMRLFEAIARGVLLAPEPILLMLDDIQWVDIETLEWLQFFFNYASQTRCLVVATQRIEEVDPVHPAAIWRQEMTRRRQAQEIVLGGLSDEEVLRLGESVLGAPLDGDAGRQIITVAEGNPLFVAEMARARLEQGRPLTEAAMEDEPFTWDHFSTTIQATIEYRLSQLTPQTRQLIDLAAVIGREFTFALLDEVSNEDQATLARALDEAWRKHVVREQGALTYDFSHDLIRVAAYAGMSATQRQVTHRVVAQALKRVAAGRDPSEAGQLYGQIAHHYEQGLMPGPAIEFYWKAAKHARESYANAEATDHYRHLLDSPLAAHLSSEEQQDIRLELSALHRVRGDWDAALAGYHSILAEAQAHDDILYQARAQRGIANVVRLQGKYDEALTWLASAVDGFEAVGDPSDMARSLWTMGEVYWYMGRYQEALDALQRQLDLAYEHDYPREICDATGTMGIVTWSMGKWEQAEEYCRQSVDLARALGDRRAEGRALITIGNTYLTRRRTLEATTWYLETLDVAQKADDQQCVGWALANLGNCYLDRREFQAAQLCYDYSAAQAVMMGDWWSASIAMANLAHLSALQRIWAGANEHHDTAIAMGEKLKIPYLSGFYNEYVRTLLRQGKIVEAEAIQQKVTHELAGDEGQFAGGEDVSFMASLNAIRLDVALGTRPVDEAIPRLEALLHQYVQTDQQAMIHHAIWSLDATQQTHRQRAIELCDAHYAEARDLTLADEYRDLTGHAPPSPEPLPKPPEDALVLPLSMAEVYQRIQRWLEE